jgi:NAD(P)-dependent dehydrogenase (short-subunit alcohol dehydrogenase family)
MSNSSSPVIDLSGRTALVTGASRGIGLAIAQGLAAAGASVMISARKADELAAALETFPAGTAATVVSNAGDPAQCQLAVAATIERFGTLDIVVNNAATNPYKGPVMGADVGVWDKTNQVNLRGPWLVAQAAWTGWMAEHGGVILNISSIGGIRGDMSLGVYNVTKAALIHLTSVMAAELGPQVRVNAIAPGLVRTDFARVLVEQFEDRLARNLPLRRIGEPADIVGPALFLVSDLAAWVTGQTLVVDGGSLVGQSAP